MNFSEWVDSEIGKRGWSRSEAARRGELSPSMFDKVINGESPAGLKFIEGVAQAFKMDSVYVYRIWKTDGAALKKDSIEEQIDSEVAGLEVSDKYEVLEFARHRRTLHNKRQVKNASEPSA